MLFLLVCVPPLAARGGNPIAGSTRDAATSAPAPSEAEVKKLLLLMGTRETAQSLVAQMKKTFQKNMPLAPQSILQDFEKDANADAFLDELVPVYAERFSPDEIRQMIAFYDSPAGRKLTQSMPDLTRESLHVAQRWSNDLQQRLEMKMREKGLK